MGDVSLGSHRPRHLWPGCSAECARIKLHSKGAQTPVESRLPQVLSGRSIAMTVETEDHFGPIDFFVIEFPNGEPSPGGFQQLLALVDSGHIRLLDLELVRKSGDSVERLEAGSFNDEAVSAFAGASASLLDDEDLDLLAEDLDDGALAAVVVFEELSILSVIKAWEAEGAELVSDGHLTPFELEEALDATESE